MTELLFLLACLLIYLYSFLYRRLSVIASLGMLYMAYILHINLLYVGGTILILTILRINKSGIRDEY